MAGRAWRQNVQMTGLDSTSPFLLWVDQKALMSQGDRRSSAHEANLQLVTATKILVF